MDTIDKVEELMKKAGISKRAMARRLGIPSSTFAHLFSKPHREHLPYRIGIPLADELGIDPNELYDNSIPNVVIAQPTEPIVFLSSSDKQDPAKLLKQITLAFDFLDYEDQFDLYKIAMQKVLDKS